MKRFILGLIFASSAVFAGDGTWTVSSEDNSMDFSIVPSSVHVKQFKDAVEYFAILEITDATTKEITRKRIRVTGCDKLTGQTAMVGMDGQLTADTAIYDWDSDGMRVYDRLALKVCYAWILKSKPSKSSKPGVVL